MSDSKIGVKRSTTLYRTPWHELHQVVLERGGVLNEDGSYVDDFADWMIENISDHGILWYGIYTPESKLKLRFLHKDHAALCKLTWA